ncbi:hypothetical protein [Neorhizobium sp. T25_13]|uniref:hypothetical protein n=1 Tax=Neorhizobium sp. T25_13 TaxID=2093830 RepID=UPI00197B9267|nr:hypothetical protein [Neorhizobium sp. T25_13]
MESLQAYFLNFPQFATTWGIFFGAGLLSFFFLLWRDSSDFSFREMFEHCVPFNVLTSKSFHMDVIIYVWRKLTDLVFIAPGLAAMALVSSAVVGISGDRDASLQKFNRFKAAYFDPVMRSWKAIVAQVRPGAGNDRYRA